MRRKILGRSFTLAMLGSLISSLTVLAQTPSVEERLTKTETAVAGAQMSGDNAWMLVCCALVLMMTGFILMMELVFL